MARASVVVRLLAIAFISRLALAPESALAAKGPKSQAQACPASFEQAFVPRPYDLVLGLLVEVEGGKLVLGTNLYIGTGHRGIDKRIARDHGRITRYLWGGEIQFDVNGKILRANETSGMLHGYQGPIPLENKVAHLKSYLRRRHPDWLAPSSRFEAFDLATQHLDPRLNDFGVSSSGIPQKGGFRHDIRNMLTPIDSGLQTWLFWAEQSAERTFVPDAEVVDNLSFRIPRLKVLIELAEEENLGGRKAKRLVGALTGLLRAAESGQAWTLGQIRVAHDLYRAFDLKLNAIIEPVDEAQGARIASVFERE